MVDPTESMYPRAVCVSNRNQLGTRRTRTQQLFLDRGVFRLDYFLV